MIQNKEDLILSALFGKYIIMRCNKLNIEKILKMYKKGGFSLDKTIQLINEEYDKDPNVYWKNDDNLRIVAYKGKSIIKKGEPGMTDLNFDCNVALHNVICYANINCNEIKGNASASISIETTNIGGNVSCSGIINCNKIDGNVAASKINYILQNK